MSESIVAQRISPLQLEVSAPDEAIQCAASRPESTPKDAQNTNKEGQEKLELNSNDTANHATEATAVGCEQTAASTSKVQAGNLTLVVPEDVSKVGTVPKSPIERADILFCLTLLGKNEEPRSFYKDSPWKGINNGLPGSEDDTEKDTKAVLVYYVDANVIDKTKKKSNTSSTWRDEPVDFEFGRDAVLESRHEPNLKLYSKKLMKLVDLILDYCPYRGDHEVFSSTLGDNFTALMSCYAEMKEYFDTYRRSLPEEEQQNTELNVESCGDEAIVGERRPYLDFGALNVAEHTCDYETARDLAVLLNLLAGMYRVKMVPTLTSIFLDGTPMIKYDNLWILFRPGTTVYVKGSAFASNDIEGKIIHVSNGYLHRKNIKDSRQLEDYSACVVADWNYVEANKESEDPQLAIDHLELEMWNVQYDGGSFQRTARYAAIDMFEDSRPLQSLPVIPAPLFDKFDGGALRDRLVKRGQKYLSIVKEPAAIRTYNDRRKGHEGLIIVDPDAYRQYHLDHDAIFGYDVTPFPVKIGDGGPGKRLGGLIEFTPEEQDSFPRLNEVSVLMPRRIEGFALKEKNWMVFEIEYVSDMAPLPTDNQIDSELILVSDTDKDALRTVLPRGMHPFGVTSDFVKGKGEGKIFLLYGPPGTGKTLTVECVANDTCRPLLRLTTQDVGLSEHVESHLRKWFTLAAKWDAILLIDEADLFLEQRREGNLERNSLSTVFLRTMEYYKGVLFLTTNRPGHIDDSFISRITYPISYQSLSSETKKKLVDKFVNKFEETSTIEFEQTAIKFLKSNCDSLNGREIRNMLQNAVASAETKLRTERRIAKEHGREESSDTPVVKVNLRHIKVAVERHSEFQEYLKELRGRDETSRARNKHDYLAVRAPSPG